MKSYRPLYSTQILKFVFFGLLDFQITVNFPDLFIKIIPSLLFVFFLIFRIFFIAQFMNIVFRPNKTSIRNYSTLNVLLIYYYIKFYHKKNCLCTPNIAVHNVCVLYHHLRRTFGFDNNKHLFNAHLCTVKPSETFDNKNYFFNRRGFILPFLCFRQKVNFILTVKIL